MTATDPFSERLVPGEIWSDGPHHILIIDSTTGPGGVVLKGKDAPHILKWCGDELLTRLKEQGWKLTRASLTITYTQDPPY